MKCREYSHGSVLLLILYYFFLTLGDYTDGVPYETTLFTHSSLLGPLISYEVNEVL